MAKSKRTVLRSRTGKKLYAVRDASGKFKDVQSYARAHAADLRRTTATEITARTPNRTKTRVAAKKK
jgi:hypothetical protein